MDKKLMDSMNMGNLGDPIKTWSISPKLDEPKAECATLEEGSACHSQ